MFDLMPFGMTDTNILNRLDNFEKSFLSGSLSNVAFRTDILDKNDSYILEAELPGFEKENISVNVKGDYLTIKAVKNANEQNVNKKENNVSTYIRKERTYGSYERSFHIPSINASNIEAVYKNGMLQITMPKLENTEMLSKQISIK